MAHRNETLSIFVGIGDSWPLEAMAKKTRADICEYNAEKVIASLGRRGLQGTTVVLEGGMLTCFWELIPYFLTRGARVMVDLRKFRAHRFDLGDDCNLERRRLDLLRGLGDYAEHEGLEILPK